MSVIERLKSNPDLCRAELSCRVGKDIISGKIEPPVGVSKLEWAMYHLLAAVEDLAKAGRI